MDEPRNVEPVDPRRVVGELVLDFRTQLGRDTLVGVEIQHPFETCLIERELLLLAVTGPIADEDAVGELAHDVEGAVVRARIDDDDLVAPRHALEAGSNVVLFVVTNDDRRYLRHRLDCP